MKAFANISMCFIFILLLFASQTSASYSQTQVIEVINSYTIKIASFDDVKVIRIAGIVCPSTRFGSFPCSEQAKSFLRKTAFGKQVTVEFWATDAAGRNVCEVFLPDGRSLGKLLVSKGYALQDKYYSDNPEISYSEKNAQNDKLGIWGYVVQVP